LGLPPNRLANQESSSTAHRIVSQLKSSS